MRSVFVVLGVLAVLAVAPAQAGEFVKPSGKIILYVPSDTKGGADIPSVARGEEFGVSCGCMRSDANADVRVVLALGSEAGEQPTGYRRLLATDEQIGAHGALRVRVPDAPGLANHTVHVHVYVVSAKGAHVCYAGKVRIT